MHKLSFRKTKFKPQLASGALSRQNRPSNGWARKKKPEGQGYPGEDVQPDRKQTLEKLVSRVQTQAGLRRVGLLDFKGSQG